MIALSVFSDKKIYPIQPKDAILTRRYEESEYAFVAGDVKLELPEAQELYEDVHDDVTVSLVADSIKSGVTKRLFRGTFKSEGSGYDPETEIYSMSVLHETKNIFEAAKKRKLFEGLTDITEHGLARYPMLFTFDASLSFPGVCSASAVQAEFENAVESQSKPDAYFNFIKSSLDYSMRDYWLDWCKHYRAVLFVANTLVRTLPSITFSPRSKYGNVLHTGYDDLIASYKEENCAPQYAAVAFPCNLLNVNKIASPGLIIYSSEEITINVVVPASMASGFKSGRFEIDDMTAVINFIADGTAISLPDDCLDLRCPIGLYGSTYPTEWPLTSIPTFDASSVPTSLTAPLNYCARHFSRHVNPYTTIDVLYRELLDGINPCENIAVKGASALIDQIEDDLVNETTKINGRVYA